MRGRPARRAVAALAVAAVVLLLARLAGVSVGLTVAAAVVWAIAVFVAAAVDVRRTRAAWRQAAPTLTRRLPSAFAISSRRPVQVTLTSTGAVTWQCELYDYVDPSLATQGLPQAVTLAPGTAVDLSYEVTPTRRGEVTFEPADLRFTSLWGLWELQARVGVRETRRVYPDFAQVARYAWLAGDRRLQEIGIKTYHQRGQGTDFAQLSEYRVGDSVRHIDWKATMRMGKPVVREFQDERDQNVMLLVDCGRRMRPDDRRAGVGATHFDQVLNAVMLLSYVALKQGDAVGAMTFGTPPGDGRAFAPRKGAHSLNALMGQLYGVQPTLTHSDYLSAARDLLAAQPKRALVIVITNFRDEDSDELAQALRLLRARHLVLFASLRERIVGELIDQPLANGEAVIDIAAAHVYEQARRDAFNRLAARDALMVDAVPERLGVELVNRYHAVKRSGLF